MTLSFAAPRYFAQGDFPTGIAAADFNGDGYGDVAIGSIFSRNYITVWTGNANGNLTKVAQMPSGNGGLRDPGMLMTTDVNGDGRPDIVASNGDSNTASVFLNLGSGNFGSQIQTSLPFTTPYATATGDVNGDGFPDLLAGDYWGGFNAYPNVGSGAVGIAVALGQGNGSFGGFTLVDTTAAYAGFGDLNGDGKLDIVAAVRGGIKVFLGDGAGHFAPGQTFAGNVGAGTPLVGDLNGDGSMDVVTNGTQSGTLQAFLGNGDGTLGSPATVNVPPMSVKALVDLDADGTLDVTGSSYPNTVVAVPGNGDGTFGSGLALTVGSAPYYSTVTDVNGDGRPDLVSANADSFNISVLLNTSPVICFFPGTLIATPEGSRAVETLAIGDLVLTSEGKIMPIRWMGRQTVCTTFADKRRTLPVRIAAGALGADLPQRDLLVSPRHALYLDGILVEAGALIGLSGITQEQDVPETFTYHHVELWDHSLVLAEGVPAETFVDNVTRENFDNWSEHEALYGHLPPLEEMDIPRAQSFRQLPRALKARLGALQAA